MTAFEDFAAGNSAGAKLIADATAVRIEIETCMCRMSDLIGQMGQLVSAGQALEIPALEGADLATFELIKGAMIIGGPSVRSTEGHPVHIPGLDDLKALALALDFTAL